MTLDLWSGTVIIPSTSCGITYDLMERIHSTLNKYEYSDVEIVLISSMATESIALTSIFGDFLHEHNGMNHVYDAKYPFGFQTYIANGRLVHCTHWDNAFCFKHFKSNVAESKIILCESPSLRYGDILHLLQIYNHSKNALILTDPMFTAELALAPFTGSSENAKLGDTGKETKSSLNEVSSTSVSSSLGLKLQTVWYPLDARLQIKELCVLLRKVCPKFAFIPKSYEERISQNMTTFISVNRQQLNLYRNQPKNAENPPPSNLISPELLEKVRDIKYLTMDNGRYHTVRVKAPKSKRLYLDRVIAQNVCPKKLVPNPHFDLMVSSLSGTVDYHCDNGQLVLRKRDFVNLKDVVDHSFVGNLNVSGLLKRLRAPRTPSEIFENVRYFETNQKIVFDVGDFTESGSNSEGQKPRVITVEIATSPHSVTSVRCDCVVSKSLHTRLLDLVSQFLVSF